MGKNSSLICCSSGDSLDEQYENYKAKSKSTNVYDDDEES